MTDNDSGSAHVPDASASLEEAENAAARAASYAEAARARVRLMRLQAGDQPETTNDTDVNDGGATRTRWDLTRWRRRHWSKRNTLGVGAATVLISAAFAASGYVVWQHHTLVGEQRRSEAFAAAARRAIVTLMSVDPDHAKDDFQRMINETTGQLKSQLQVTAVTLVQQAQDAKVITKATVEEAAVQSMTDDSAVVLVAATSITTNPDKTTRPPGLWRLSVNIERENGQLKMSKIAFLQ